MLETVVNIPKLSPKEKKDFNIFFNKSALPLMRLTILVIVSASLGYFYLDYLSAPYHYKLFWTLRAFVVALYVWVFFATFKFKEFFIKNFQIAVSVLNILYNLVILAMIYFSSPEEKSYYYYFIGLIVIWVTSVPLRIRLVPFLYNAVLIGTLYVLIAIFKQKLLEPDSLSIFINNMFFFLSTFLAVVTADIVLEAFIRRSFLDERILEMQNAELEEKNSEISSQNEEITHQKKVLEKRHKQILESIHYAHTIQNAILPANKELERILERYFLIYLPKQQVSGDFYYARTVGRYKIIAVGDCTGHGVPGGFLAMLSISKIDNIVLSCRNLSEPSVILEKLREQIKQSLSATRDGLDLSLCVIDQQTKMLYFSGAYNHLYILREQKLEVLKAVKTPIGQYPRELPFETKSFQLRPNDVIYMLSDGMATQRNKENIPYGSRRLMKKLTDVSGFSLDKQHKFWLEEVAIWADSVGQLDDITILAFEI